MIKRYPPTQEDCAMAGKEQLKPDDFPVHTEQKKIVKPDGKDIAEARTPKIADEIAERLNAGAPRRERGPRGGGARRGGAGAHPPRAGVGGGGRGPPPIRERKAEDCISAI